MSMTTFPTARPSATRRSAAALSTSGGVVRGLRQLGGLAHGGEHHRGACGTLDGATSGPRTRPACAGRCWTARARDHRAGAGSSAVPGGPVDELLGVAVEGVALEQLQVEVGGPGEDRGGPGPPAD